MSRTAILLLAHGTPNRLSEMSDYLRHVTHGRPIPPQIIEELQHRYAQIGLSDRPGLQDEPLPERPRPEDRPPLTRWTLRQAELLEQATGERVYVGMRNWHPFIADIVAQMKADGVTHARVLCLAPQNSRTSTGLYKRALDAAVAGAFTYDFTAGWADSPLLAQAFAERLQPILSAQPHTPVLFTAHSVPCRTVRATTPEDAAQTPGPPPADSIQNYGAASEGDPYPIECKQTAAAVANICGLDNRDWYFAFQSQGVAGAPWIGPTVEDTLKGLADEDRKAVIIQPIGFLCDHVEILYDIDINFRQIARDLGIQIFRPESLNDSPTLIRALAHVLSPSAVPA